MDRYAIYFRRSGRKHFYDLYQVCHDWEQAGKLVVGLQQQNGFRPAVVLDVPTGKDVQETVLLDDARNSLAQLTASHAKAVVEGSTAEAQRLQRMIRERTDRPNA